MKAIILARVSTKDQEDNHSIEAQLIRLRKYCKNKGFEIVQEFKVVESSTRGGRPEFNKMVDFIKKSKVRLNVVVDAVDRLQRGFKETPIFDGFINDGKVKLHFLRETMIFDEHSKNSQKMMWDMSILMAKSYVGSLSDNVKRSIEKKLEEGTILGYAPIGYLNLYDGKGGVELDPDRAFIIKRLFEEYSTGLCSLKDLRMKSKEVGLRSKTKAGGYLSSSQIHNMIQNPFYYGMMKVKGKLYPHIYPSLISKKLFDIYQDIRKGRGRVACSENITTPFIFRGLITCSNCERIFTPEMKKNKYVYLRPNPKKGCNCKPVNENIMLEKVQDVFKGFELTDEVRNELLKCLKKTTETKKDVSNMEVSFLSKSYNRNKIKLDNLLDMRIDGSITKDEYDKRTLN